MVGGAAPLDHSFTKEERLLKRVEFLAVTEGGKKLHTRNFIVFVRPNKLGLSRIGITVTKKVGSSVVRNRIKRVVREFFRLNKALIETGIDIVVIAKKDAVGKGLRDISLELGRALIPASKTPSHDMAHDMAGNMEEKRG